MPVATEIRGFHGTTPVPIDAAAAAALAPVCCIFGRRPIPALPAPIFFQEGAFSNCAEYGLCPFEHFPDYIAAGTLRPVSFPSGYTMFGHFLYEKMDISGYGQNVLGAMTVAIIAGVAWCVRNKFKHSNCELDSGCLKVTSHEDEEGRNTIRREILDQLRAEGVIPAPVVEEVASAVSETNL